MNHPFETAYIGNVRHQQMIQAADKSRRIKTLSRSRSPLDLLGKLRQTFTRPAPREVKTSTDPALS